MSVNEPRDKPADPPTAVDVGSPADRSNLSPAQDRVLFVDLDGTIIKTDLLWESFFVTMKTDPLRLLKLPFWLTQGRAVLKERLCAAGMLDVQHLPYRNDVLELLAERRSDGWRIVLATAAARSVAEEIATELQVFDDVLATEGEQNLKGAAKLAAIKRYCEANEFKSFAYVGDSHADLAIWKEAEHVYAAAPSTGLSASIRRLEKPVSNLGDRSSVAWAALRALRPKQWVKNLLLFVPLIMAHEILDWPKVWMAILAFVAFSLCASSIYVLNDLMDLSADRHHPISRHRPFAAGTVPLWIGLPLSAGLTAAGLAVAAMLPLPFFAGLLVYLAATSFYTWHAKNVLAADVILLAGLYAIRVIAGGLATGVPVSQWLIAFSMFVFLSLAFAKRNSELVRLRADGRSKANGRAIKQAIFTSCRAWDRQVATWPSSC